VEQTDLLKYAVESLDRLGIEYAIVGSFASGVWGEARFTQDIDIVIKISDSDVKRLCTAFPQADFYVSEAAAHEAVRQLGQFNVIHPASGNKIDFMIAGRADWSKDQLARRHTVQVFPDRTVTVAAPEDVILGKLIYFREGGSDKHLRDIASILQISADLIDRDYIDKLATQLGVGEIWQAVLARVSQ
jgi:hypothetical protein